MTIDEMCAFAYKATRDMVFGILADEHMEDYDSDEVAVMGEAVSMIPAYEEICKRVYPYYTFSEVKEHVVGCIMWAYPQLSTDAFDRIVDKYHWYTTILEEPRFSMCS
ncbi:hypothetical protein FPZ44_24245 [Paenibacillus agilis]|uniref:Uncharacterized protein n=2 Tax=Paenibacillus agilis TaxID=3020863 RepID=A0A559IF25_9BACL|nr:hypothetical protein FPZ44_24245 [Paenibacillus agilis]